MAISRICYTFQSGVCYPIVFVQGNATDDAKDKPVNGKKHSVVSVHAITSSDGTTLYVDINGWGDMYPHVLAVRKGDSILVVGSLNSKTYRGKKYYNVSAFFVAKNGVGLTDTSADLGDNGRITEDEEVIVSEDEMMPNPEASDPEVNACFTQKKRRKKGATA